MFQKNKKEKAVKVEPEAEAQEIEEIEDSKIEKTIEKESEEDQETEDYDLDEETVKMMFKNITTVLNDLSNRVSRIEYHLRLDFN